LKIALCIRKDFATLRGGVTIQLLKTKEQLQKLYPIELNIVTDPDELTPDYDIAHIFNLATKAETAAFFQKAAQLRIKTALSTIFWDYTYQATRDFAAAINYAHFAIPGLVNLFRMMNRVTSFFFGKPRIISKGFRLFVKNCLQTADLLLPNSPEELQQAALFSGTSYSTLSQKTQVVVNATEPQLSEDNSSSFRLYNLPDNYILQVGRIEYIKNQLGLLEALKGDTGIPIVFLGRSNDPKYFETVKRQAL
jgi:glycosyltransferase involved in cell wall biosynthesis